MAKGRARSIKISRDTILFVTGLCLTIFEAVFRAGDRPTLLLLYAGMMGLPFVLRADEVRRGNKPGGDNDSH